VSKSITSLNLALLGMVDMTVVFWIFIYIGYALVEAQAYHLGIGVGS